MCIAAWAWQSQPAHHLLLLFNRDEYHSRPTRPAGWWAAAEAEGKEILGGRDELGGGTWLGCTRDGKLAFLTNVREPSTRVGAKSRGELPVRFLQALRLGQSFNRFLVTHDGAEFPLQQMVEQLMMDTVKPDRSAVPDTGVDPDWEYHLSSIFIDTEKGQARYGTRSMAAIAMKFNGEVIFYERYLESNLWKENLMQFELETA
ncbi:hypothetical protein E2562_009395 [Oryza meyeriana var. granulata]|uniref:Uncharacterized protein n=1 Tax=Oryza meyeriana var. granulata TaxID=110450 RepID=A0A6G1BT91_9ORYZ|nr:hypothetical protein E2562_009395 [Oryza meyeriana var. granulata]